MLFTQLTDSKMHGFEVYMGLRNTKVSVFKFYLCNKHCMESTYFCANFLEDFFLFLCFCFLMMGGGHSISFREFYSSSKYVSVRQNQFGFCAKHFAT